MRKASKMSQRRMAVWVTDTDRYIGTMSGKGVIIEGDSILVGPKAQALFYGLAIGGGVFAVLALVLKVVG